MLADIQSGAALLGVLTGENQNFLADFRKVNPKVSDDEIVNTALLRFLLDPLRRYIAAYEQPIISSSVDEYAGSSEMTFGDD